MTTLLTDLQDLKRIAPAGVRYSLADELFVAAWRGVLAGRDWAEVADETTVRAIVYVLLPGVDTTFFRAAELSAAVATGTIVKAFDQVTGGRLSHVTRQRLRLALPGVLGTLVDPEKDRPDVHCEPPACIERLRQQPRAGATHPDFPRLVLLPAESHADHCLLTAVYACLYAAEYAADPGLAFVCALAHHLHNAYLPDCGWAGELALEPHLDHIIATCRRTALKDFPPHLRPRLLAALKHHETIATPAGKAVSSGDVLDRVLDVKWRTRAAAVTDQDVLGDLDLVHPGPLKDFQTELLNATGLWITA